MFAIVTIAGQQFKVRSGQEIFVNRLSGEVGDKISFSEVLMTGDGGNFKAGSNLSSASVEAEIVNHLKGDKVIVFKKKRRKGYQKSNGYRASLTRIRIGAIA